MFVIHLLVLLLIIYFYIVDFLTILLEYQYIHDGLNFSFKSPLKHFTNKCVELYKSVAYNEEDILYDMAHYLPILCFVILIQNVNYYIVQNIFRWCNRCRNQTTTPPRRILITAVDIVVAVDI